MGTGVVSTLSIYLSYRDFRWWRCACVSVSLGRDHSFSNSVAQAQPKYGSPDSIEYTGRAHLFFSLLSTRSLFASFFIHLARHSSPHTNNCSDALGEWTMYLHSPRHLCFDTQKLWPALLLLFTHTRRWKKKPLLVLGV